MTAKYVGHVEFPITVELGRGLEGAIACQSGISTVDGTSGKLVYRGYTIETLAKHSNYEEVAYLLLFGHMPTASQFEDFRRKLADHRPLPGRVMRLVMESPRDCQPMLMLMSAVAGLGACDPGVDDINQHVSRPADALPAETDNAIKIISQIGTLAAYIARVKSGQKPVPPRKDLSYAANFLYMVNGEEPDDTAERVLDIALMLHAEHELNASTFAGMVIHSTLSDMYSAIAGAIGALKGPLHGGANQATLAELRKIGTPDRAAQYIKEKLDRKERFMGFGHRVYKAYDPRARILRKHAKTLAEQKGQTDLWQTAEIVEQTVIDRIGGKGIFPNVDFFSGIVYDMLGIDAAMFPVLFAVARTAGWSSWILEYLPDNRLFRPRAVYTGEMDLPYVPIEMRENG